MILLTIIFGLALLQRHHKSTSSMVGGAITPTLKVKVSNGSVKGTLTENVVRKNIMKLDIEYDKNAKLKRNFSRIRNTLHPFSALRKSIRSRVLDDKEVVITNAFMKCYEFITTFNIQYDSLYDIASAPGMFVICADYIRHSKTPLRWHACSYIAEGSYLDDTYGLFKMHPDCFENVNVLNDDDIKRVIKNEHSSYDLVLGDIGCIHGYNELQEESHKELQRRQALLAAHLTKKGGNAFLKMYSCITAPSIMLVSNLSKYFRELYLWKPYTSRITNVETYIVALSRNDKPYEESTVMPKNAQLFYKYYNDLATYKNVLVEELLQNGTEEVNVKKWLKDISKVYNAITHLAEERIVKNKV